jgi:hypothetical protein
MSNYKMPTKKSYVGDDMGSRIARMILDTSKNYKNMGNTEKTPKTNATKGRNNPRGAKGAR